MRSVGFADQEEEVELLGSKVTDQTLKLLRLPVGPSEPLDDCFMVESTPDGCVEETPLEFEFLDESPLHGYLRNMSFSRRHEKRTVRIVTEDEKVVDIPFGAAEMSVFLKDWVDQEAAGDSKEVLLEPKIHVIAVPFDEEMMLKVVEYLEIHEKTYTKEIQLTKLNKAREREMISPEDLEYLRTIPREDLFEISFVAEYLQIDQLANLLCAYMSMELNHELEPANNLRRTAERPGDRERIFATRLESLLLGIPLPRE